MWWLCASPRVLSQNNGAMSTHFSCVREEHVSHTHATQSSAKCVVDGETRHRMLKVYSRPCVELLYAYSSGFFKRVAFYVGPSTRNGYIGSGLN